MSRPRVLAAFEPLVPIAPGARVTLGIAFFVCFFALWGAATWGGWVKPLFLADPARTFIAGWRLLVQFNFAGDIAITIARVVGGFVIAAALAVPIGIAMGAFKPVEAFLEPFASFARYLPASAFIPLLILWFGVDEKQKLAVIFIGAFFQIVLMIAVLIGETRRDLVEAAYTLGAGNRGIVFRVMLPAAAPQVAETLRLVLGWAWTYVIVAELIGAEAGIGHMIMDSQRFLDTGQMIFGIFLIGLIGLVTDLGFRMVNRRLFPWQLGALTPMASVAISAVERTFPGVRGGPPTRALEPVDITVADNDFVAILGPSGCGKSTLLRIVAGLDRPTGGRVAVDGVPVERPGADRGMVFQSYTLFPWLTVRENIGFGPRERGVPEAERRATADRLMAQVGLTGFADHYPRMLSGGMQQRTALARALANDPKILLLDEPFGALDHQTRALMQELLLSVWEADRKTVLFVTHDIEEAVFMANRVLVMTARPGRIKSEIAVPLPHPRHWRMKTMPEFAALKEQLTESIREETLRAAAMNV